MGLNADERFVERNGRLPSSNSMLYGSLLRSEDFASSAALLKASHLNPGRWRR